MGKKSHGYGPERQADRYGRKIREDLGAKSRRDEGGLGGRHRPASNRRSKSSLERHEWSRGRGIEVASLGPSQSGGYGSLGDSGSVDGQRVSKEWKSARRKCSKGKQRTLGLHQGE